MILARSIHGDKRYWLINSKGYAYQYAYNTIKECFETSTGILFNITNRYTINNTTITLNADNVVTDEIIWQHPTDLTYEEFCEQFPEYLI